MNKRCKKSICLSTDEDYCKPIRTSSAFNGNYIEYQSKEGKTKILSIKE